MSDIDRINRDLTEAAQAIGTFLKALGFNPTHEVDLRETPWRVAQTFSDDLLAGYSLDPAEIFARSSPSERSDLIIMTDIDASSVCPHHLMPSIGQVHVAYLPGGKVAGFGAIARLVDCYTRRLLLQENIAGLVCEALCNHLHAQGAGCIVDMTPTCLCSRGDYRHRTKVRTQAMAGSMANNALHQTAFFDAVRTRSCSI